MCILLCKLIIQVKMFFNNSPSKIIVVPEYTLRHFGVPCAEIRVVEKAGTVLHILLL